MQQSAQPLPVKSWWLNIWIKPRAVIQDVLETNPSLYIIPIMLFGGSLQGWSYGLVGMLFGLILAVPGLYLSAFLVRWVGQHWFGGTGSGENIRAALVWGGWVPNIQIDILFFVLTLISSALAVNFSVELFSPLTLAQLYFAFRIWIWVISLKAIGEAHDFSSLLALLTQLTIVAIFAVPFFLFSVLF